MRAMIACVAIGFAAYLFDQGWRFVPLMILVVVFWEYFLHKPRIAVKRWWRNIPQGQNNTSVARFSRGLTGWPR